jgi:hypothetical protein
MSNDFSPAFLDQLFRSPLKDESDLSSAAGRAAKTFKQFATAAADPFFSI